MQDSAICIAFLIGQAAKTLRALLDSDNVHDDETLSRAKSFNLLSACTADVIALQVDLFSRGYAHHSVSCIGLQLCEVGHGQMGRLL